MMITDILAELRAATGPAHARLESTVRIEEQISETARYGALLGRFLGFYEPMEELLGRLRGWDAYGLDLAERRKAGWLKQDLAALGWTAEGIAAAPRCKRLPRVECLADGYGCAYVMEGATLGGRQISAMMRESALPLEARRFFQSYGSEVGARWSEFTAGMDAFCAGPGGDRERLLEAAAATFDRMQEWLDKEDAQ